jgi:hypothetical protein
MAWAASSVSPNKEVFFMKAIAATLIVVGIIGLVVSAIFPVIVGIAGIIGSLVLLLTGIGFLLRCCFGWRK